MQATSPLFIPCPACHAGWMQMCQDLITGARTVAFHSARSEAAAG